jgi:predicted RNA-binding protein YlqC (UPF0109 family)
MRPARDEIISFVKALALYPDKVHVTRTEGNPVIFEIKVCKEDMVRFTKMQRAIQTIARSRGLEGGQLILKFLEK